MKKHPAAKTHPDLGFQIAPMIDVVFVIMLFFMVMAGSAKVERELKARLPGGEVDDRLPLHDDLTIAIDADGAVALNDTPLDSADSTELPALTKEIRLLGENARRAKNKLLVTVAADETARYERVACVLNALAKAGASENVTFTLASGE